MPSEATIVMTLAGPLQSWGTDKGTKNRRTGQYPTKSGVLGIIAAAQGRAHGAPVTDLNELKMAVRVDHHGTALTDFHTARGHSPSPKFQTLPKRDANTTLTDRGYRADAVFVVFLSGDRDLIDSVHTALLRPVYAPFLGRRAAVPSMPVYPFNSTVLDGAASKYVESVPWRAPIHVQRHHKEKSTDLIVVRDACEHDSVYGTMPDLPLGGYAYLPRDVVRETVTVPVAPVRRTSRRAWLDYGTRSSFVPDRELVLRPKPPAHNPFELLSR